VIVVDTNVIAYLFLPGEQTAAARRTLQRDPRWAAPLLVLGDAEAGVSQPFVSVSTASGSRSP
jgi:predicted nucleic acid-binding protein